MWVSLNSRLLFHFLCLSFSAPRLDVSAAPVAASAGRRPAEGVFVSPADPGRPGGGDSTSPRPAGMRLELDWHKLLPHGPEIRPFEQEPLFIWPRDRRAARTVSGEQL